MEAGTVVHTLARARDIKMGPCGRFRPALACFNAWIGIFQEENHSHRGSLLIPGVFFKGKLLAPLPGVGAD